MPSIYDKIDSESSQVIDEMRDRLAKVLGVTVVGNRCTVRWSMRGEFVNVHMIIESITTPSELKEEKERDLRFQALRKKYPDIDEDLYYVEHGEHSK